MKLCYVFLFVLLWTSSSHAESRLGMEWQSYVSPPAIEERSQDYLFLNWDSELKIDKGKLDVDASLRIRYGFGDPVLFYYDLPEIFVRFDSEIAIPRVDYVDRVEVVLGRKIKTWSEADDYWDLGLWNSQSLWNPLYPEENGLIGSFVLLEGENVALDMFMGCCYVPDRNPPIKIQDGKILSRSRWTTPLYENVESEAFADIRYLIRRPVIFKLLFQESYIVSLKTWSKTKNTAHWIKVFFGSKPANQINLAYSTDESIEIGKDEEGALFQVEPNVILVPVRNNILSAEGGINYKNLSTVFTLENVSTRHTYEIPRTWNLLHLRENFTYFSALIKYNITKKQFVRVGYIHSWFHNYKLNRKPSGTKSSGLISRTRNLRGLSLDWFFEYFSPYGLKRNLSVNYQHSLPNKGGLLRINTLFHFTPRFSMTLSTNVLGSSYFGKKYFLNLYRHNDYFSWSLNYEF